jgi:SnoaL-like protein
MSDETVALIRRNYEVINAIGRTGPEFVDPEELAPDLWARLDPHFELHERPDLPDGKVYRGPEATKEFWGKIQQLFAEMCWEPREFFDLGDVVVVDVRIVATGRGSDVPIEADEFDVAWFRGGRLVRLAAFPTRDQAFAAAGRPSDVS